MKKEWALRLAVSAGAGTLITAFDWLRYPGGVRGFTSWPARFIVPAVWPTDWFIAKDPSLYRWARFLFWSSNILVWALVLLGVWWLASAVDRRLKSNAHA